MTTYNIKTITSISVCSPSVLYNGRLVSAPSKFVLDAEADKDYLALEAHFKDVYMTLMKKLVDFALRAESSDADHQKLRELMNELIWVRTMLQK